MTTLADLEARADAWLDRFEIPAPLEPCRDLIRAAYCAIVAEEEQRTNAIILHHAQRDHAMGTTLSRIALACPPPTSGSLDAIRTSSAVHAALHELTEALEVLDDGKI